MIHDDIKHCTYTRKRNFLCLPFFHHSYYVNEMKYGDNSQYGAGSLNSQKQPCGSFIKKKRENYSIFDKIMNEVHLNGKHQYQFRNNCSRQWTIVIRFWNSESIVNPLWIERIFHAIVREILFDSAFISTIPFVPNFSSFRDSQQMLVEHTMLFDWKTECFIQILTYIGIYIGIELLRMHFTSTFGSVDINTVHSEFLIHFYSEHYHVRW